MERVIMSGQKIDLHIHSCYSAHKDGDKVLPNSINSIDLLAKKLTDNNVNIVSITDHDVFSYDLYSKLKKEEEVGSIRKVLPGVEFSIMFDSGSLISSSVVHIVAIFDDQNDEKVKNIENILGVVPKYKSNRDYFTEQEFLDFLRSIELSVILIGHQKNSVTSKKVQKNDVSSVGDRLLNDLIFTQYFEAFEFKNRRNEVFNKKYIVDNSYQDNLRFITGSDCHVWENYPNYDQAENIVHNFTYLKCLPTFRGLVMSFTDHTRIKLKNSFFSTSRSFLEKIVVVSGTQKHEIQLSKGINAIIGDNSIGKSLLLHAITDYVKVGDMKHSSELLRGYKGYLKKNGIKVESIIDKQDLLMFDTQGQIREKFEKRDFADDFLNKMFIPNKEDKHITKLIDTEIEKLTSCIQSSFHMTDVLNSLPNIEINADDDGVNTLNIEKDLGNINEIIISLNMKDGKFQELNTLLDSILELDLLESEKASFLAFKSVLYNMINENRLEIENLKLENEIINLVSTKCNELSTFLFSLSTDYQKQATLSKQQLILARSSIYELYKYELTVEDFNSKLSEVRVPVSINRVHNYNFIERSRIDYIDSEYFMETLRSLLKVKHKRIKTKWITRDVLVDAILRFNGDESRPEKLLAERLRDKILEDIKRYRIINDSDGKDVAIKEMSSGFNQTMYFDLLCNLSDRSGIYIIDQPEDNVSQKSISESLISKFKQMSQYRQIILVTHNPQFIVNLDVDNVIYMSKNSNSIEFNYGALEYEENGTSILKLVVDNIEGGVESLKKRWNRYEKNTNI